MTTIAEALPMLGLRIDAGPLEMRGITDDLLGPLADIDVAGIHDPDAMPFYLPWSIAPADVLPTQFAQHHWTQRSAFSPGKWALDLAVFWEGELAVVQKLALTPEELVRFEHPLEVDGLDAFRRSIGLVEA